VTDADLERLLAERPSPDPPAGLRLRVLAAARRELARPPAVWRPWAVAAAAVLLGINLSMSLSADTDWHLAADVDPRQAAAMTSQLRTLAPDLPESELRRQALLARAGAELPRVLNLSSSMDRTSHTQERDRWDVR
jgi:hypothetical protein